jgi:hypothetical protein
VNIARKKVVCIGTVVVVIALIGTCAAQISQSTGAVPVSAQHLTHKQAARLIYTASTSEDHRALAQYFRQEAQRKRDKEQHYMETAATYRLHPPRVDMYRNDSTQNYYTHLADEARVTASADDLLANYQEKLANEVGQEK